MDMATGRFDGHGWGENIGWVRFKGSAIDYNVRTLAFDTQSLGTPNWWLALHNVAENYDEGDTLPAWKEYVADTDPTNRASYFHIVSISNLPPAKGVFPVLFETILHSAITRKSAGRWLDKCHGSDRHSWHRRIRFLAGHDKRHSTVLQS